MPQPSLIDRIWRHEDVNFLLTNRIPRGLATRVMGWFSRIEHPLVRDLSIATWTRASRSLNLEEAKKTQFRSLHDCFIRELKDGARPIDESPDVLVSPCDALVGAFGRVQGTELIQAKGFPYTLEDLLGDTDLVERYRDGTYVTLRLTPTMYHRFHAPYDCDVDEVTYISGDTWNVNPIAVKRIERLYCKNERAVVPTRLLGSHESVTLVPVGAILVASIHFNFLEIPLNLTVKGRHRISCRAPFRKGQEMGYFAHGSTIIVFATSGLVVCDNVTDGAQIRMGEPLLRHR